MLPHKREPGFARARIALIGHQVQSQPVCDGAEPLDSLVSHKPYLCEVFV